MRTAHRPDLTEEQRALIKDLFPAAKTGARPRTVGLREVVNALMYQARTGVQWDYLPHDLLPKSTVWDYFVAWQKDGTWQKVVDALRGKIRKEEGREETPSAACIDTQTVKSTEIGGGGGGRGGRRVRRGQEDQGPQAARRRRYPGPAHRGRCHRRQPGRRHPRQGGPRQA